MSHAKNIDAAAKAIVAADALLITAGAGMGVDSGLPDFRGDHGLWSAYPAWPCTGNCGVGAYPAPPVPTVRRLKTTH